MSQHDRKSVQLLSFLLTLPRCHDAMWGPAIFQWQGQHRCMHRVNRQHILDRSCLLSFHQKGQRKLLATYRWFLLSFIAQDHSKSKKHAFQQPQLGVGRLLKMNTKKVVGTATSEKPAKRKPGFLTELICRNI